MPSLITNTTLLSRRPAAAKLPKSTTARKIHNGSKLGGSGTCRHSTLLNILEDLMQLNLKGCNG
jgi:hypothetical protein